MDRKEFLEKLGLGAAFVLTSTCILSCKDDDDMEGPSPRTDFEFTLDLTEPDNAPLNTDGGYIVKDQVVVARTIDGNYVAATQLCSHESFFQVVLADDKWLCIQHGAEFSLNGEGLNENGERGLLTYSTELNGTMLTVRG